MWKIRKRFFLLLKRKGKIKLQLVRLGLQYETEIYSCVRKLLNAPVVFELLRGSFEKALSCRKRSNNYCMNHKSNKFLGKLGAHKRERKFD